MFSRARRQLTLISAASGAALFVLMAIFIFFTVVAVMDREIDADIQEVVAESIPLLALGVGEQEVAAPVAFGPVFAFAFSTKGALIGNPRDLPAGEMVPPGLVRAAAQGEEIRSTRTVDGERFRLHFHPVLREGGEVGGVIVAGRSLARRDQEVRVVGGTLAGGAVVWSVLVSALAYIVAGRALAPVREAYVRQEAFVAGAAHELRSPIAVIRAASEVGLRGSPPPATRDLLQEIETVATEASTLVDTLLDLARLAPADGQEAVTTDMAAVVGRELARMRPLLEEHRVRVVDDLERAPVHASATAIGRVTRAILENVIAHTPPGTSVVVRTRDAGIYGELSVEDNGPGLPPERLEAVFEPFSRGDTARRRDRGAGMGLSIVRNVAWHHHGWARARQSTSGTGLVVEVGLPASRQRPTDGSAATA
jgi:signal transduction histidine kinase